MAWWDDLDHAPTHEGDDPYYVHANDPGFDPYAALTPTEGEGTE
jgi:hypothetical protein